MTKADLGAAGPAVFASGSLGIVGPEDTEFGPALFRVNAILPAQNTSFDEARPELIDQFALESAQRAIADMIEGFDDLLAGGATLEELADETDLQLGRMDWTAESIDGIAAHLPFRITAASANEEDFPEIQTLDDGGVFALRIDSIAEPRLPDFESVRAGAENAWRRETTVKALAVQAEAMADRIRGGADPANLGLEMRQETEIRRDGFIPDAPMDLLDTVFEMSQGDIAVHEGETDAYIVRLDEIGHPRSDDTQSAGQRSFIQQLARPGTEL